ncbi:MAG: hypothetical protein HeimC2_18260 [Candidatus Heimdallarchaeota archaeon LC_2]|nr:MAG: hypothetical protein HeimC2_18260 [Candidatus Heimdallarchaeota archaeon LC_2]
MSKEIGGDFNISLNALNIQENRFNRYFKTADKFQMLVDSGRTALYVILQDIMDKISKKPLVYVPNYLCDSVVEPIRQLGLEIRYYNVIENKKFNAPLITELRDHSVVLRISYFGDPKLPKIEVRNREKIFVIDDMFHNPYLMINTNFNSNYIIASLRKYFPISDGGIVISDSPLTNVTLSPITHWSEIKISGMILKNVYLNNPNPGLKAKFLSLLRNSEQILDTKTIGKNAISKFSSIMLNSLDYDEIKMKRINNYRQLEEGLVNIDIQSPISDLADQFVPLGFPILTNRRDEVKLKLIEQGIYPPIHWELENIIPHEHIESHLISSEIITLPIDQRYGNEDIQRIIKVLQEIFH